MTGHVGGAPEADADSSALAAALARRADRLASLRSERERAVSYLRDQFPGERRWHQATAALRRAVIVVGSPRGGTSVVHRILRGAEDAVAPLGEHRFLFTLHGWNFPDAGVMRECIEDVRAPCSTRRVLLEQVFHECWEDPIAYPTSEQRERFAWNWALRFRLQWPELDIELEWLVGRVCDVAMTTQRHDGAIDEHALTAALLRSLLDAGLPVNPHLYALNRHLRVSHFSDVPESSRTPTGLIVEIPPFIVFGPRSRPRDATARTLVLKASSDAYRVPTLIRLFEGWEMHWLHLTRNPLAAVNGLIDGWTHPGFWQHDLSDLGLSRTDIDADGLWCFDIFPRWSSYIGRPLPDICAEQWRYPHSRIWANLDTDADIVRVRFEEFTAGENRRRALVEHLIDALGMARGPRLMATSLDPPVVNATATPTRGRWRATRPWLISLIDDDRIAEMAAQLGYQPREAHTWS